MSILSQIIAYAPNKIDTEVKARAMVGEPTDEQTQFGKPIYQTPEGEKVSEKSMTLFFNGDWMNVPSIQGGKAFNEDELRLMIKQGKIQPTSVHKSKDEAEAAAKDRSDSMIQEPRYMYAGGQLVQPSADGSRPGYAESREIKAKKEGKYENVYKNAQGNYVYRSGRSGDGKDRIYKSGFKTPEAASKWGQKEFIKQFNLPNKFVNAAELSKILGFGSGKGSGMQSPLFERGDRPRYLLQEARKILGSYKSKGSNFFRAPTKKEIEYLKKYNTSPIIPNQVAKNVQLILDSKAIMNDLTGKNKSGKKLPDFKKIQKVFANAGIEASDAVIANALQKAAYLLRGDSYQTNVNFNKDKATGNFIIKEIEKLPFDNQYTRGIYKHALQEISKELGDTAGNLDSFKRNFKKRLPKDFLEKHNLNVNEIFSVRASVRNKSYPYAYFIDVIDADINQKALRSFHGALSNAQTNLNNKIKDVRAGKAKYDDLVEIVEKFNGTRDKFKETIKTNYGNKPFNLPNIVLGKESEILKSNMKIPSDIYSKKLLDKWQNQGLDITGHAKKTGYVMTGAADKGVFTAQDLSRNPEIRNKAIAGVKKNLLEFAGTITDKCKIGNAEGGRIGFKTGSADCLRIAKEGLEKGLKNGFPQNQQVLANGILKSSKFLKDAVSLRGLFGPAALAFTAAAEAGIVGYDMLSTGKSFREAVGESVFNSLLGDKTKIDSVKERNKRMIEEGMTPEQMGKIGAMESAFGDLARYGAQFNKLAAIDRNRKAISMSPEDAFNEGAFQLDLDRQEDEARQNIQDFNRSIIPSRGGMRLENIDYAGGFKNLAEGLARNEFAQLQSVDNPLQSRRGDEKRAARMNELMLQYPDLAPGYDFMEGGIASLNVSKK